jgi:hypothetical protein
MAMAMTSSIIENPFRRLKLLLLIQIAEGMVSISLHALSVQQEIPLGDAMPRPYTIWLQPLYPFFHSAL